ncbi:MAG: conserved hypothetical protein [Methanobrevibacter sp. CfCl-M3]
MSKMKLKKYLKDLDKSDIIKIFLDVYSKNKDAKEYLNYLVEPNEEEQFEKAKKIIKNEYFPERGLPKTRLSVAKKAIRDFSRLNPSPELEAELMLFLVEQGCELIESFGMEDNSYYIGMINNYEKALDFMDKNNLLKKFQARAERCTQIASEHVFFFGEELYDLFIDFYTQILIDDEISDKNNFNRRIKLE